jgi:hypothetical protein
LAVAGVAELMMCRNRQLEDSKASYPRVSEISGEVDRLVDVVGSQKVSPV